MHVEAEQQIGTAGQQVCVPSQDFYKISGFPGTPSQTNDDDLQVLISSCDGTPLLELSKLLFYPEAILPDDYHKDLWEGCCHRKTS